MTHPSFAQVDHRPYPLPDGRWTWHQTWYDLLFAHWPVQVDELQPLVPDGLEIDTFDGVAWIGVVPFSMRIRYRYGPPIPTASCFPELNVRTYVKHDGKSGVWFMSLDASSRLAVWAARRFFYLPYSLATMQSKVSGEQVDYQSHRSNGSASFVANFAPTGPVFQAEPGTLEHWLTERYRMFAQSKRGQFYRGEIHHAPWPLQPARVEITENTMLASHGLNPAESDPIVYFAKRVDVALWPFVAER